MVADNTTITKSANAIVIYRILQRVSASVWRDHKTTISVLTFSKYFFREIWIAADITTKKWMPDVIFIYRILEMAIDFRGWK